MVELYIQNGDTIYAPSVLDGIEWDTERKNTPGKLTFKVAKDNALNFTEGNSVVFRVDWVDVFYGFVFQKRAIRTGLYLLLRMIKCDTLKIKILTYTKIKPHQN